MMLSINGVTTEHWYCQKHHKWNPVDDEMNCCEREKENDLMNRMPFKAVKLLLPKKKYAKLFKSKGN